MTTNNPPVAETPDRHAQLREKAHFGVLDSLRETAAQGVKPGTFGICVFDARDPNLPDQFLKHLNEDGYVIAVITRPVLKQSLEAFEFPAPGSGILWNGGSRKWVTRANKPARRFPTYKPFVELAKRVDDPDGPGEFLVATFVGGSIALVRASLEILPEEPGAEASAKLPQG